MNELKPCPFCGGKGEIEKVDEGCFGVGCPNCDFQLMNGPWAIGWHRSRADAATEWNRRTPTDREE
jgi:Lar family restriction alleviation protein